MSVCPLWGSRGGTRRGGGRRAGIRVIPSDPKEFKVSVQFVIESVVGVGGFEILPVLLAKDTEIVRGHCVPAKVGHGLEVVVERWFSEFGWWGGGCSRGGWEGFITTGLTCRKRIR